MQENEIKILLDLKEKLKRLIAQKQTLITEIELEMKSLQEEIIKLDAIISTQSFTTADNLLDLKTFLDNNENTPIKDSGYTKKVFSTTNELFAVLKFENRSVFIRFLKPLQANITQDRYIEHFVKPILIPLKTKETKMKPPMITKIIAEKEEFIETIKIEEIQFLESFDLIEKGIHSILNKCTKS